MRLLSSLFLFLIFAAPAQAVTPSPVTIRYDWTSLDGLDTQEGHFTLDHGTLLHEGTGAVLYDHRRSFDAHYPIAIEFDAQSESLNADSRYFLLAGTLYTGGSFYLTAGENQPNPGLPEWKHQPPPARTMLTGNEYGYCSGGAHMDQAARGVRRSYRVLWTPPGPKTKVVRTCSDREWNDDIPQTAQRGSISGSVDGHELQVDRQGRRLYIDLNKPQYMGVYALATPGLVRHRIFPLTITGVLR